MKRIPWIQLLSTSVVGFIIVFSLLWIQGQKERISQQIPEPELFPKYDETNKTVNTYHYPPILNPKLKNVLPNSEVYKTAVVYGEWERPQSDGTGTRRFQLVRSGHKYPLLMVARDFSTEGIPEGSAEEWVADHFLVTLREGYGAEDLQNSCKNLGAEIRGWSRLSNVYTVAFNPFLDEAAFKLQEKLQANPIILSAEKDYLNRNAVKSLDHP